MTSVIYASISAVIIVWLSLNVIKVRRANRISLGDGDNQALITAMAAQTNATEYIPLALLLLFALEYNNASLYLVHVAGVALIVGRLLHAKSILSDNLKGRVLGMQITIFTIIGLAASNLIYLPYTSLLSL